ncbi:MAG: Hsp20/alpha crystallin family protein [Cyanobacteriota bacterium]
MRTLRTASAFELFDRLDQQLQQQRLSSERVPVAEIIDHGESFEVLVELPGIDRTSLQVNATDRTLSIEAHRPASSLSDLQNNDQSQPVTLMSEFRYGSWNRSFRFPTTIDRDQLQASYRDGLLRIRAVKANTRTSVPVTLALD